jgi:thimet oligopeptidase
MRFFPYPPIAAFMLGLVLAAPVAAREPRPASSAGAAAAAPQPAFPKFADPAAVEALCTRTLADAKRRERALERMAPGRALLARLDDLTIAYEDAAGPLYLLQNVHPDKALRDAAEACTLKWDSFFTEFAQNARVHRALAATRGGDAVDARNRKLALEGFEDSGVALPEAKRARARAINDRLNQLTQDFYRNIREDKTTVAFAQAELEGVPEGVWKDAKKDEQGRLLLTLAYPQYVPVMEQAVQAATRERMWRAKQNEGGDANLKLLDEIVALRREYAGLFGYPSYADFALRRRMAANAANVERFLADVKAQVAERELRDLAELRAAKAAHLGQPAESTRLERWDFAFYQARLKRERYSVDQEQFRAYFPPEESLAFVFEWARQLFGLTFQPQPQALWHAEARAFTVADAASGRALGTLYVDLYPREAKYNHAAVWSFRSVAERVGRRPQAALVVNFDRKGLTLDEMETLLHEFGHAIHALASRTRYAQQGGTNVLLDFVEAPSQMLEAWAYDPGTMALFAKVCAACKPVPAALLEQAKAAKTFGKGVRYARQHQYASYDLQLNGPVPVGALELWQRIERATPLGYVEGTKFPAGFGHLAGGYAAGYYSYLWSEVTAEDLRTAFKGRMLDVALGRRYRDTVLAQGGQVPPDELIARFLGRPRSSAAFFDSLKQ